MRWLLLVSVSLGMLACNDDTEEHHFFSKGCPDPTDESSCGYHPEDSTNDPPPAESNPPAPPPGCPGARSDVAKSGLTSADLRALLPGKWLDCNTSGVLRISVDQDGRLVAGGAVLTIGACGETSCPIGWGEKGTGTMQVWSEPDAIRIDFGSGTERYVRNPEP